MSVDSLEKAEYINTCQQVLVYELSLIDENFCKNKYGKKDEKKKREKKLFWTNEFQEDDLAIAKFLYCLPSWVKLFWIILVFILKEV